MAQGKSPKSCQCQWWFKFNDISLLQTSSSSKSGALSTSCSPEHKNRIQFLLDIVISKPRDSKRIRGNVANGNITLQQFRKLLERLFVSTTIFRAIQSNASETVGNVSNMFWRKFITVTSPETSSIVENLHWDLATYDEDHCSLNWWEW